MGSPEVLPHDGNLVSAAKPESSPTTGKQRAWRRPGPSDASQAHVAGDGPAWPRRAFRPYHSMAVPRAPHPLGAASAPPYVAKDDLEDHCSTRPTTAMLRNIPNKYTQTSLLEEIDEAGFADTYDFFYLPMDVHNCANVGYAFVNFLHSSDFERFCRDFSDRIFHKHRSVKIGRVSPAHIQGLAENLQHFANRAVTWSRNSQYRPVVKFEGQHRDLCDLLADLNKDRQSSSCKGTPLPLKSGRPTNDDAASSPQTSMPSRLNPAAEAFVPAGFFVDANAWLTDRQAQDAVQEEQAPRPTDPPLALDAQADDAVIGMASRRRPNNGYAAAPGAGRPSRGYKMIDEISVDVDRRTVDSTPIVVGSDADSPSEPFTFAKQKLEEAVSQWLRTAEASPTSAGEGSSTRSSSNSSNRTPRSMPTTRVADGGIVHAAIA